jgi:hypothetical protein
MEFKADGDGKMLEDSIRENRYELKENKMRLKELTEQCN